MLVLKTINTVPTIEAGNFYKFDLTRFLKTFFYKITDLSSLFKMSSWSFLFLLEPANKNQSFRPCSEVVKDQKFLKVLLVLPCFIIQTLIFQPHLFQFLVKMSIGSFLIEVDSSFLKMKELIFCVRNGITIDQNWQSAVGIDISRYSTLFFSKTTHLKIRSSCVLLMIKL